MSVKMKAVLESMSLQDVIDVALRIARNNEMLEKRYHKSQNRLYKVEAKVKKLEAELSLLKAQQEVD